MKDPVLVVVGLIPYGENPGGAPTYVVTLRQEDAHLGGSWELPGGKVQAGESPPDALRRELAEELGVEVEGPHPITFSWHAYAERTVLILFYEAPLKPDSPAPRPLVARDLQLVDRNQLLALPLPPANDPFKRWLEARGD